MSRTDPTFIDLLAARRRITPFIRRTPLLPFEFDGVRFLLKLENRQRTRSFKLRGALSAVTADGRYRSGHFYTASAGNHGLGAAGAVRLLGGSVTVVVSRDASVEKVKRIHRLGGKILLHGRDYDEAEEFARQAAQAEGRPFLHAFDDPLVISGQGTVALELLEQAEEIDTLIVPVGGGGLISGCALAVKHLRPDIRVIGVQPAESPAMIRSLERGSVVETPIGDTICAALEGRFVSERTLAMTQAWVDEVVAVREDSVAAAVRLLSERCGLVLEPSAAVGLAAWREGLVPHGRAVALVISGGNISREHHAGIVGSAPAF